MIRGKRFFLWPNTSTLRRGFGDQRKERIQARPLGQTENRIRHFIHRILLYEPAAIDAIRASNTRKQQSQVVINLGRGSDGRTRAARR